jgi:hypothetical protein
LYSKIVTHVCIHYQQTYSISEFEQFQICHFGIELKSDGIIIHRRGKGGCRIYTQNAHFLRGYASIFQTNPNSVAQGAIENYAVIQCITRIV